MSLNVDFFELKLPPAVPPKSVDQLTVKVTADVPTAVLSTFDENSTDGALIRQQNLQKQQESSN